MFENLNPIFSETKINHPSKIYPSQISSKKRKPRSDKCHPIKIPVTFEQRFLFKASLKQFKLHYPQIEIKQTKYNTLLFLYALDHLEIVNWDLPYKDSDHYMTAKPLERDFEDIGGIYGLANTKGMSERKTAYMMMISALEYIEKGDYYHELYEKISSNPRNVRK